MGKIMTIKVGQVPAENLSNVWADIVPGVQHVLDMYDNKVTLDNVKQQIEQGYWWLVLATDENKLIGTFICSCEEYADYSVMFVHVAVGEPMSDWKYPIIEFMKQGAKAMGANCIEWRGRKGMMKAFSDVAKIKHVSMVIPVENENG